MSGGGAAAGARRVAALQVTRVGAAHAAGGTMMRTPPRRLAFIAPPRASTTNDTRKLGWRNVLIYLFILMARQRLVHNLTFFQNLLYRVSLSLTGSAQHLHHSRLNVKLRHKANTRKNNNIMRVDKNLSIIK